MLRKSFYHRFGMSARRERGSVKGFTLIELLIVIAIILILIAIALPNFLEAQIRARTTKAKGEIRTFGIAMESYFLDFGVYPSESENFCPLPNTPRFNCGLAWLTSPIAYITDIPEDPFPGSNSNDLVWYEMGALGTGKAAGNPKLLGASELWAIFTRGPDNLENEIESCCIEFDEKDDDNSVEDYSPTNGTKSFGDIFLYGGDGFFIGKLTPVAIKTSVTGIDPLRVNGVDYVGKLPPDSL